MLKRAGALIGALGLIVAPVLSAAPASAASVGASCANTSGSITATVGETITIGASGGGCDFQDTASSGVVVSQSFGVFLATAAGSGSITAYTADDFGSYTNTWSVTVSEPAPQPTAPAASTPAPSTSTTSTPSVAAPSASPTPVPLVTAQATAPLDSQTLTAKEMYVGAGLEPGTVAFFNDKGHPLQLLTVTGDRDAIRVLNRGMDYSATPANWQRLGYGDLCWSYAGYRGVTGLVLPVATPPFSTVPADWVLTAAIATTSTGNRILLDPVPGELATAGGRDINALTLCADGFAPTSAARTVSKDHDGHEHGNGNHGGNVGTGQCRGNGNYKHGCEPEYPRVPEQVVWPEWIDGPDTPQRPISTPTPSSRPSITPTPDSTETVAESAVPTAVSSAPTQGDPLLPICRATGDPTNPYRFDTVRVSEVPEGDGSRLFPTPGWTDVIPPNRMLPDGLNWPAGAEMLSGPGPKCQVQRVPVPQETDAPTPTATTIAQPPSISPTPGTTPSQVPQPVFTAFTTITPWPPRYPIPVPTQLIPVPTPTPTASTPQASPVASPTVPSTATTPEPTTTPSPGAQTGSPTASPTVPSTGTTATPPGGTPTALPPSPFPIPASPTAIATPTPTPTGSLATPQPMPQTPTLIPPLKAPSVPLTPVIAVREPVVALASPTASPTAEPRPSQTATPVAATATPTGSAPSPTASPTLQPLPSQTPTPGAGTATPSALAGSPTASPPIASPTPSTPTQSPSATTTDGARTITFLLTNGPDTVTFTTSVEDLQAVVASTDGGGTDTTGTVTDGDPGTDTGPTELANTGASAGWLIVGGITLAGGALLMAPLARGRRGRVALITALTAGGVVLSTTSAWSVASAERAFSVAQAAADAQWSGGSQALGRISFARAGIAPVYVFDGVDDETLTRGPGWYPTTAPLGNGGNTAIAGHRTGYGSPFAHLDQLRIGDPIVLQTPRGDRRTYAVSDIRLVDPADVRVLGPDPLGTGVSTLTLTTCDPPGINTKRLIVIASLRFGSSPA